jgi:hypothetical protein
LLRYWLPYPGRQFQVFLLTFGKATLHFLQTVALHLLCLINSYQSVKISDAKTIADAGRCLSLDQFAQGVSVARSINYTDIEAVAYSQNVIAFIKVCTKVRGFVYAIP